MVFNDRIAFIFLSFNRIKVKKAMQFSKQHCLFLIENHKNLLPHSLSQCLSTNHVILFPVFRCLSFSCFATT